MALASADIQKFSKNPEGHVEYFIKVYFLGKEWAIRKRYRDFERFDHFFQASEYAASANCKLPAKSYTWFRNSTADLEILTLRQKKLQAYLDAVLSKTNATEISIIREFLEVDENNLAAARKLSFREFTQTDLLNGIVTTMRESILPIPSVAAAPANNAATNIANTNSNSSSDKKSVKEKASPGGSSGSIAKERAGAASSSAVASPLAPPPPLSSRKNTSTSTSISYHPVSQLAAAYSTTRRTSSSFSSSSQLSKVSSRIRTRGRQDSLTSHKDHRFGSTDSFSGTSKLNEQTMAAIAKGVFHRHVEQQWAEYAPEIEDLMYQFENPLWDTYFGECVKFNVHDTLRQPVDAEVLSSPELAAMIDVLLEKSPTTALTLAIGSSRVVQHLATGLTRGRGLGLSRKPSINKSPSRGRIPSFNSETSCGATNSGNNSDCGSWSTDDGFRMLSKSHSNRKIVGASAGSSSRSGYYSKNGSFSPGLRGTTKLSLSSDAADSPTAASSSSPVDSARIIDGIATQQRQHQQQQQQLEISTLNEDQSKVSSLLQQTIREQDNEDLGGSSPRDNRDDSFIDVSPRMRANSRSFPPMPSHGSGYHNDNNNSDVSSINNSSNNVKGLRSPRTTSTTPVSTPSSSSSSFSSHGVLSLRKPRTSDFFS